MKTGSTATAHVQMMRPALHPATGWNANPRIGMAIQTASAIQRSGWTQRSSGSDGGACGAGFGDAAELGLAAAVDGLARTSGLLAITADSPSWDAPKRCVCGRIS